MKTVSLLKEAMVQIVLTTFIIALTACGPAQNTEEPGIYNQDKSTSLDNDGMGNDRLADNDSSDNAMLGNETLADTRTTNDRINDRLNAEQQDQDTQFLVSATKSNLKQIQLAQLAQKNGKTAEVRELGTMMEKAHTQSQKDLTALAQRKNIRIPTSLDDDMKNDYNALLEASEDDFDKTYTEMMIKGHEDSVQAYEKASSDSMDSEIKNWATASLPEMRKHLEHSLDSKKKSASMMYLEKN